MDFLGPTAMMMGGAAAFSAPYVSMTSANIGGFGVYGYIRPGGRMADVVGASGGSLSSTLLPGFVTDAVYSEDIITVVLMGDALSALDGLTGMTIDGLLCLLEEAPVTEDGITYFSLTGTASFVASTTQTIQLI